MRLLGVIAILLLSYVSTAEEARGPGIITFGDKENQPGVDQKTMKQYMAERAPNTEIAAEASNLLVDTLTYPLLTSLLYGNFSEASVRMMTEHFQEDLGADVTGHLTMDQYDELSRRNTEYQKTPVYAGGSARTNVGDAYASAEGTWQMFGEKAAYPINKVEIRCWRNREECFEFEAIVDVHDAKYQLHTSLKTYSVIHWGPQEVIALSDPPLIGDPCYTSTLRMNASSGETTLTTANNTQEECKVLWATLPPLDAPLVSKLVDGFERTYQEFQTREDESQKYLNPRFAKEIEAKWLDLTQQTE
jgi:hypothetical protein